jgi:hypothetical protein
MHRRFSQDIEALLKRLATHPLTLQDILEETSERGFSIVIFLLALPFLFPVPPGMPGIIAPASLLLSGQMAMGKHKPWLPKKIARFRFPKPVILQLLKNLKRVTKILERITRPRLRIIANNPYIWRINGFAIAWLTILLVLPIPGTNFLPAIGILLLSVATLEADGVLMCIAYLWSIFVTSFFCFIGYTLLQTSNLIFNH